MSLYFAKYQKPIVIVIIVLLLAMLVFANQTDIKAQTAFPTLQSLYSNSATSGQLLIPDNNKLKLYTTFSPNKIAVCKLKKIYQIEPTADLLKTRVNRNADLSMSVIMLFLIFYQLSRTSSETPVALYSS
jgi:hypothetical protein